MQLKVRDYRIEAATREEDRVSRPCEAGPVDLRSCDDEPGDKDDICRICLGNMGKADNPLVSACKCTGSMKFMHADCVRQWLNSKLLLSKGSQLVSYYWKTFECEICKSSYPRIKLLLFTPVIVCILHKEKRHDMVNVEVPATGDFVLLENINREKGVTRAIYLLTPTVAKSSFKIGRGHETDLRITDISVSRFHALIKCTKDGLVLEDNSSKFGTLIWEPGRVRLDPESTRVMQVGRTVIQATAAPAELSKGPAVAAKARKHSSKYKKAVVSPVHIRTNVGGKASPNSGDENQMEDIPDEDENLM